MTKEINKYRYTVKISNKGRASFSPSNKYRTVLKHATDGFVRTIIGKSFYKELPTLYETENFPLVVLTLGILITMLNKRAILNDCMR